MDKALVGSYGFKGHYKENFDKIKAKGFTHFMTSFGYDHQNGPLEDQVKYAESIGLKKDSIHCYPFKTKLPNFWVDCAEGDEIEQELINEVRTGSKYGFRCLVVHSQGTPSQIGIERFKRILKVCEECDFPLAIENLDYINCFRYIFENIEHPYLKVCYDSGHQNTYTPNDDILAEFGDKVICTHLHDNDGTEDWHTVSEFGNIDWEKVGKQLADTPVECLGYELLNAKKYGKDEEYLLSACYKDAERLDEIVTRHRNNK